jgi:hypothetical protein
MAARQEGPLMLRQSMTIRRCLPATLALTLLAGGLGGCQTGAATASSGHGEPVVRPETTTSADSSQVMTISLDDLFIDSEPFATKGESSTDAWNYVESTGSAEPRAARRYSKPGDPDNTGPNLSASLYGDLIDDRLPRRAASPTHQTSNARQVTFTGEGRTSTRSSARTAASFSTQARSTARPRTSTSSRSTAG